MTQIVQRGDERRPVPQGHAHRQFLWAAATLDRHVCPAQVDCGMVSNGFRVHSQNGSAFATCWSPPFQTCPLSGQSILPQQKTNSIGQVLSKVCQGLCPKLNSGSLLLLYWALFHPYLPLETIRPMAITLLITGQPLNLQFIVLIELQNTRSCI